MSDNGLIDFKALVQNIAKHIESASFQPTEVPVLNSRWVHKNGNQYTVICVTNLKTTRHEEYPITVVYRGDNGNLWSRLLSRWYGSMTEIKETS